MKEDKKSIDAKIPYCSVSNEGGEKECKVSDLWKKGLKDNKWARMEGNLMTCTFTSNCCIYTNERSVEIIEVMIDKARIERIKNPYEQRSVSCKWLIIIIMPVAIGNCKNKIQM